MKSYKNSNAYDASEIISDLRKDGIIVPEVEIFLNDLYMDAMLGQEVLEKVTRTLKSWKKLNRVPFKEVKELLGKIEFQGF